MNWKAGDKAVCIKTPATDAPDRPLRGNLYLVSKAFHWDQNTVGLLFAGLLDDGSGWDARNFRKVIPRSERIRASVSLSNAQGMPPE